jgi:CHAT domain-containing protein/predicted enzyme related to lactoylglutathione lyase
VSQSTDLIPISGCENSERIGDVIFVPGLGGDVRGTWHPQGKRNDNNFWLAWLGEELPDVGIWSLGYEVEPLKWKGNTMPLFDLATNILAVLDACEIGDRPLIFIAHSLGGLLVKQMLRLAWDYGTPEWKRIVEQTKGIVFLSTPHSGSNMANWVKYIGVILQASVSVDELEVHHSRLRELNEVYRNHEGLSQIPIQVYWEKQKTSGFLVVDETSANPGIKGVTPIPMDDDHLSICRPKSKESFIYRRVNKFIRTNLRYLYPVQPESFLSEPLKNQSISVTLPSSSAEETSTKNYDDEIAVERVVGFLQQFDRAHFDLACHAAFPLVITPDLLYQIWLRFVPQAPWTAVARVLLSRLCREVGYELYEMDIAVRNLLLADIKDNEEFNKDKSRLEELADFLTNYVTQQFSGDNPHTKNLAQAQYWTALAYTKPERLSRELLEAINLRLQDENWKELFRLSSLVETFAEPLAEFAPLLITYARGMASFTVGDVESATEQFSKLPRRDHLVDIDGVNLSIPDEVPLTTVELEFLLQLLQVISDSNGNSQIVYPILQENLDKLDDSFSVLLCSYVANFVSREEPEQVQAILPIIVTLSNLLTDFPLGNRANNLEIAIAGYEIALSNFTFNSFPKQRAMTQNNLGRAFSERIRGERAENLERAIAFYEAALQVRTRQAFPQDWAMTQNNLATAYSNRIKGDRGENIERAIAFYEAALQVRTRQAFPQDWAMTQNNLATAYSNRIKGDRGENIERAIAFYEAAFQVYTRDAFPRQWAMTQNNLGRAFSQRINGERAKNLERAIHYFLVALEVYTRDAFPLEWAETVNNLGFAYRDRIQGYRAENLERAISYFFSALEVYTREAFPQNWANTQSNLGIAYRDRIQGDRAENLEQAINCFMNALQVYTCDAFPQDWAETQNNLGITYLERTGGDRADNLEQAIYFFQNALQIYTRPSFPQQNHLETLFNLALAYQNTHQLTSAYDTFANIIESLESFQGRKFYRLEIQGGQQEFTEQLKKVYQRMVEVCLQLSYTDKAIEYVERSKAHSLVELLANYDIHPKGNIPDSILNELQRLRFEISIEQLRPETKDKNRFLDDETFLDDSLWLGDSSLFPQKEIRLTQLQQQLDELINHEILPIDPNFNLTQPIEPIIFAQIQSIIPNERTAILEWYVQDDNFQTFIITQQSALPSVWQSSVENGSALIEWTNEYFQDYLENKRQWQEQLSLRLQNLTQILHLDEILNYLPTTCDQLILIPHRFLHCIPLHALPLADGSCLLDRFPGGVRHAPSCQLLQLVQTRQRPEFSHFFAIQNPNQNLAYTDIEVETIKQYFPYVDILAKAAATKDALSNKPLSLYHCLHFSSGSHFNTSSPLLSALILADAPMPNAPTNSDPIQYLPLGANGVIDLSKCLTVEEIFKLDLSQCRLVTLSASETALTDWTNGSNEYIGFPGAFLFAGSASVIGSLWGINDLSTALLMIKFYQNLQRGLTVAVALNQAQLWLRDITKRELEQLINANQLPLKPAVRMNLRGRFYRFRDDWQPFREPFHWAAFCAIGQ